MQGKRIYRSRNDRLIAGVAGGVANYLNIDPLLVRIGFVALTALNGFGAMLYIVLWLLLPNEDSLSTDSRSQVQENISEMQTAAEQLLERVRGAFQR
jgi:phage shock protein C